MKDRLGIIFFFALLGAFFTFTITSLIAPEYAFQVTAIATVISGLLFGVPFALQNKTSS